jgi:hypothetical protein
VFEEVKVPGRGGCEVIASTVDEVTRPGEDSTDNTKLPLNHHSPGLQQQPPDFSNTLHTK